MSSLPSVGHFQSETEAQQVRLALAALDAGAGSSSPKPAEEKPWMSKGRKISPKRLYEHLNAAARDGRLDDVNELIALGSPLVAAASWGSDYKTSLARSALRAALAHKQLDCALALLRQPDPLGPSVSREALWRTVVLEGSVTMLQELSSPPELFGPASSWPTPEMWLDLACDRQRMDMARDLALANGLPLNASRLDKMSSALAAALQWADLGEPGSAEFKRYEDARDILKANAGAVSESLAQRCFISVVEVDSPCALRFLLELGLRPSSDWSLDPDGQDEPIPLALWAYAKARPRGRPQLPGRCFNLMWSIPPIVEATLKAGATPWLLSELSWSHLQEIERLGVDLGAVDEDGDCFAHFWARQTASESLPLLKSVMRDRPDFLEKPNHEGATPRSLALSFYPKGARDELRKALVAFEKKELSAEALKPARSAKPARSRL